MHTNETLKKWISVCSCPNEGYISIPSGIDGNNYIAVDCGTWSSTINCIRKYNIDTDTWSKIDGFNNVENVSLFNAALDVKSQTLFLLRDKHLTEIQLATTNIVHGAITGKTLPASGSKVIIANNALLKFGCTNIVKYDYVSKTLTTFSDMYNKMKFGDFGLVHKNNYLLFGGYDWVNQVYVDYILEFNIKTKQWNKLPISLPQKLGSAGCTMAINDTYVLIFAGEGDNGDVYDDIYIYSLKSQTIKKSEIKCPIKGRVSCVTVNDNIKDEKLVFGYVRDQWKMCSIDDHYFPPCYLLKIMHSFYLTEFVYCLAEKHYKISTLDIV